MSIEFNNKPLEWNEKGKEPPEELKESGFLPGHKPPAAYFNSFMNKTYKSIDELQEKVSEVDTEAKNKDGGNADKVDGKHADELQDYRNLTNKPESMKNPNPLTFTGETSGTYDGSDALSIALPTISKTITFYSEEKGWYRLIRCGKINQSDNIGAGGIIILTADVPNHRSSTIISFAQSNFTDRNFSILSHAVTDRYFTKFRTINGDDGYLYIDGYTDITYSSNTTVNFRFMGKGLDLCDNIQLIETDKSAHQEEDVSNWKGIVARNFSTADNAGFFTDDYGNFVHKQESAYDNWNIYSNAEQSVFKVNFETGNVDAKGTLTAKSFSGSGSNITDINYDNIANKPTAETIGAAEKEHNHDEYYLLSEGGKLTGNLEVGDNDILLQRIYMPDNADSDDEPKINTIQINADNITAKNKIWNGDTFTAAIAGGEIKVSDYNNEAVEITPYGINVCGKGTIHTQIDADITTRDITARNVKAAAFEGDGSKLTGLTKSQITDLSDNPANGGNADTVGGKSVDELQDYRNLTNKPESMKNPYALTIQGNGTAINGTYDGSAAKTVNITPDNIGAASSSHTHIKSQITDFPESMKNPKALTFTGGVSGSYDGSSALSVTIPTIPTKLPNPNALTFTGETGGTYDGSNALSIALPTISKTITFYSEQEGWYRLIRGGSEKGIDNIGAGGIIILAADAANRRSITIMSAAQSNYSGRNFSILNHAVTNRFFTKFRTIKGDDGYLYIDGYTDVTSSSHITINFRFMGRGLDLCDSIQLIETDKSAYQEEDVSNWKGIAVNYDNVINKPEGITTFTEQITSDSYQAGNTIAIANANFSSSAANGGGSALITVHTHDEKGNEQNLVFIVNSVGGSSTAYINSNRQCFITQLSSNSRGNKFFDTIQEYTLNYGSIHVKVGRSLDDISQSNPLTVAVTVQSSLLSDNKPAFYAKFNNPSGSQHYCNESAIRDNLARTTFIDSVNNVSITTGSTSLATNEIMALYS